MQEFDSAENEAKFPRLENDFVSLARSLSFFFLFRFVFVAYLIKDKGIEGQLKSLDIKVRIIHP